MTTHTIRLALLAISVCVTSHAKAGLIASLVNPGFETNDGHGPFQFDETVNGWLEHDPGPTGAGAKIANYSDGEYDQNPDTWPTITGNGALVLDIRTSVPETWIFQSLGVVTQQDIDNGLAFQLAIDAGTRVSNEDPFTANAIVAFRIGTGASGIGSIVGSAGTLHIDQPGGPSAVPIQLQTTSIATYTPTAIELGQTVYGVVSMSGVTFRSLDRGSQYYLDNATVSAVPEPSTLTLASLGLIGLIAFGWRQRRGA